MKNELITLFENEYLAKILGFCYQKVTNREDAEDLAADIALEALKAIHRTEHIENFNAFVWSISNHIFFKWLRAKKNHGTTAYMTELFEASDNTENEYLMKEQENLLHREIAHLSEKYRQCIVLYYFENKSLGEISDILGKSTGTIKWWLHEARNSIREGMNTMREYGERSYNPERLDLSCQGNPGKDSEPMSLVKRKSTQNILLAAYKEPLTIGELCMELGISAPYIEDEMNTLVYNQLMKEVSSGRYQTDFVILPEQNIKMSLKLYESCFPGYYNELMKFLEKNKDLLTSPEFNTADFTWNRLLWVYIHIVTDIVLCHFKREVCKIVMYDHIPIRPNGGRWIALGFKGDCPAFDSAVWREYTPFDGPVHKTDKAFAQGFFHYWSGLDSSIFFETPDDVFALCRDIIKKNVDISELNEEQQYLFSIALEKKLFIKDGENFKQNYFFATGKARKELETLAMEFYPIAKNYFDKAWQNTLNEYQKTVPKHLHWQMGNFLSNALNNFVTCSLYEALKNNVLSSPDEHNEEWLSLFTSEY